MINLFKRKKRNYLGEEHIILAKKFKVLSRWDILTQGIILFGLGFLIYSPFQYYIKFGIAVVTYLAIVIKEKNAIEMEQIYPTLKEWREQADEQSKSNNN